MDLDDYLGEFRRLKQRVPAGKSVFQQYADDWGFGMKRDAWSGQHSTKGLIKSATKSEIADALGADSTSIASSSPSPASPPAQTRPRFTVTGNTVRQLDSGAFSPPAEALPTVHHRPPPANTAIHPPPPAVQVTATTKTPRKGTLVVPPAPASAPAPRLEAPKPAPSRRLVEEGLAQARTPLFNRLGRVIGGAGRAVIDAVAPVAHTPDPVEREVAKQLRRALGQGTPERAVEDASDKAFREAQARSAKKATPATGVRDPSPIRTESYTDAKGRQVFSSASGALYIMKDGKKVYVSTLGKADQALAKTKTS